MRVQRRRPLTFRNFDYPRWQTAALLKAVKSPYLSKDVVTDRHHVAIEL